MRNSSKLNHISKSIGSERRGRVQVRDGYFGATETARNQQPDPSKAKFRDLGRDLGRRAREVAQQLDEATDELNESLRKAETLFVEKLGANARGRTSLCKNEDGWIEHFVFRDGKFRFENGWPGEALSSVPLLSASREIRTLAGGRVRDLWEACGGMKGELEP